MVDLLLSQTQEISAGGDDKKRSIDPPGLFGGLPSFPAPIINTSGVAYEQYVSQGATWSYTPTLSNSPTMYHWWLDVHPNECTVNPLTGEVTLDTTDLPEVGGVIPDQSMWVELVCSSAAGEDRLVLRIHVGKTSGQIKFMGPGETYTDLDTARAALVAGDTLVIRDGNYTGLNNTIYLGGTHHFFPSGTAQTPTIAMSESPGKWVIDGEGVRNCFNAIGGFLHPDWPGGNDGAVVSPGQTHIWVLGLRTKESTNATAFKHAERIQFRYCIIGNAHDYTDTHNISGLYLRDSQFGVMESCFVYGYNRYAHSTYQSRNNVIRRGLSRHCAYFGTEPANCSVSIYRDKNSLVQNSWCVDSPASIEKWIMTGFANRADRIVTAAFQVASTGAYEYPVGNKFQRCGNVNVFNGTFHSAGFTDATDCEVTDFVTINPESLAGVRAIMLSNSRAFMTFLGLTVVNGNFDGWDDVVAPHILNCQASISITNALLDVPNIANITKLVNTWGSGATESIANYSAPGVIVDICDNESGRNDVEATKANGLMYPTRQEKGGILELNNLGANNLDFQIGRQGTYQDDIDAETETNVPVLPFQMEKTAMEAWRETDWTGPNEDVGINGSATRLGDFGVASAGESPSCYILAGLGHAIFPLCVNSVATDVDIVRVSWEHPASDHHNKIIAYDVFYKNETDAGAWAYSLSVDFLTNAALIDSLLIGKLYKFYVRSRYVDGRLSGKSYESEVQL